MWGKRGIQTDSRRRRRLAFLQPTWALASVAVDCSFIGDSAGSVVELTCASTTLQALPGSWSRLADARWCSPSPLHPACPCVGRVAVKGTVLREGKGLWSRSSSCALSPGVSANKTGVGTISSCVKRMAYSGPYTEPLARRSFLRMVRISSSGGHPCRHSWPIRPT